MNNLRYFNDIAYGNFKDLDVLVDPDGNKILVTYPTIEKVLGYQPEHAHEKIGGKKAQSLCWQGFDSHEKVRNCDRYQGSLERNQSFPFYLAHPSDRSRLPGQQNDRFGLQ